MLKICSVVDAIVVCSLRKVYFCFISFPFVCWQLHLNSVAGDKTNILDSDTVQYWLHEKSPSALSASASKWTFSLLKAPTRLALSNSRCLIFCVGALHRTISLFTKPKNVVAVCLGIGYASVSFRYWVILWCQMLYFYGQ